MLPLHSGTRSAECSFVRINESDAKCREEDARDARSRKEMWAVGKVLRKERKSRTMVDKRHTALLYHGGVDGEDGVG